MKVLCCARKTCKNFPRVCSVCEMFHSFALKLCHDQHVLRTVMSWHVCFAERCKCTCRGMFRFKRRARRSVLTHHSRPAAVYWQGPCIWVRCGQQRLLYTSCVLFDGAWMFQCMSRKFLLQAWEIKVKDFLFGLLGDAALLWHPQV